MAGSPGALVGDDATECGGGSTPRLPSREAVQQEAREEHAEAAHLRDDQRDHDLAGEVRGQGVLVVGLVREPELDVAPDGDREERERRVSIAWCFHTPVARPVRKNAPQATRVSVVAGRMARP